MTLEELLKNQLDAAKDKQDKNKKTILAMVNYIDALRDELYAAAEEYNKAMDDKVDEIEHKRVACNLTLSCTTIIQFLDTIDSCDALFDYARKEASTLLREVGDKYNLDKVVLDKIAPKRPWHERLFQ